MQYVKVLYINDKHDTYDTHEIYYAITDKTDDVRKNKMVHGADHIRKDETPSLDKERTPEKDEVKKEKVSYLNVARQCRGGLSDILIWSKGMSVPRYEYKVQI